MSIISCQVLEITESKNSNLPGSRVRCVFTRQNDLQVSYDYNGTHYNDPVNNGTTAFIWQSNVNPSVAKATTLGLGFRELNVAMDRYVTFILPTNVVTDVKSGRLNSQLFAIKESQFTALWQNDDILPIDYITYNTWQRYQIRNLQCIPFVTLPDPFSFSVPNFSGLGLRPTAITEAPDGKSLWVGGIDVVAPSLGDQPWLVQFDSATNNEIQRIHLGGGPETWGGSTETNNPGTGTVVGLAFDGAGRRFCSVQYVDWWEGYGRSELTGFGGDAEIVPQQVWLSLLPQQAVWIQDILTPPIITKYFDPSAPLPSGLNTGLTVDGVQTQWGIDSLPPYLSTSYSTIGQVLALCADNNGVIYGTGITAMYADTIDPFTSDFSPASKSSCQTLASVVFRVNYPSSTLCTRIAGQGTSTRGITDVQGVLGLPINFYPFFQGYPAVDVIWDGNFVVFNGPRTPAPPFPVQSDYPLGDGGNALNACLRLPMGLCFDANNDMYIADTWNHCIRKVTMSTNPKIITTVAGIPGPDGHGYNGGGLPGISTQLHSPWGIWYIAKKNWIIFAENMNNLIRYLDLNTGLVHNITVPVPDSFGGADNTGTRLNLLPASSSVISRPRGIAMDKFGAVYVCNGDASRVDRLSCITSTGV